MAASAYAVSLPLLLWMAPVIIGLVLSIPIAMLSSRLSRPNSRLFRTPEESDPPQVLVRANELASAFDEVVAVPLRTLRDDPQLLEKHLANLPADQRRNRGQIDPHLAIARAKIEDAQNFDEAVSYLTPRETFAVLNSPNMLRAVCAMPRAQEHQSSQIDKVAFTEIVNRLWCAAIVQQAASALRRMGAKRLFVGLGAPARPVRHDEIAILEFRRVGEHFVDPRQAGRCRSP